MVSRIKEGGKYMAQIDMDPKVVKKRCKQAVNILKELEKVMKQKHQLGYVEIAKKTRSKRLKKIADDVKEGSVMPIISSLKEAEKLFGSQMYNEADQFEKMLG